MAESIILLLIALFGAAFISAVIVMIGGIGYVVLGSMIAGVALRDREARNAFFRSHERAMLVIHRAKRFAACAWLGAACLTVLLLIYAFVAGVLVGR